MTSVLHIGNIAGAGSAIKDQQIKAGVESKVVIGFPSPYNYPVDEVLQTHGQRRAKSMANIMKIVWQALHSDNVHYHSFLPCGSLEILLLKAKGVDITIHYHGSDIRGKGQPWIHSLCANQTYVSTPDLMPYCEDAEWYPAPILENERLLEQRRMYLETRRSGQPVRVLHTPTDKDLKGTKYIRKAVEQLVKEGRPIEYKEYSGLPHEDVLERMACTDIYIDQLLLGAYGTSSVECAYLSVPVICNYVPAYYWDVGVENIPFYNANKHTIYGVLKEVLSLSHEERLQIGAKCNEYYQRIHARN